MNISDSAKISFYAKLDKTNPKGIFIGTESYIAGCIVAGNPARIIKENIQTKKYGQLLSNEK